MDRIKRSDFINFKYSIYNIINIALLYLIILCWPYITNYTLTPITIILSILFFTIQQRHLSEWLHEGLHYNLHHKRSVNEFVTKWILSATFFIPLEQIRKSHFEHHSNDHFFEENDPDTGFAMVKNRSSLFLSFFQDILGYTAFKNYFYVIISKFLIKKNKNSHKKNFIFHLLKSYYPSFLLQTSFVVSCFYFEVIQYLIIYYLSMLTTYPLVSRIRLYSQHLKIDNRFCGRLRGSDVSRTIKGSLIARTLISSRLMQYHREHHETPNLPFRAIEKLAYNKKSKDLNIESNSYLVILKALWNLK